MGGIFERAGSISSSLHMSTQLQSMLDTESIKSLKAKYFRSMDTKDWASLSSCFTEDLVADFREAPGMLAEGRDNYMSQLVEILKDASTVHHGHMPEIEIIDEEQAVGVWAMDDGRWTIMSSCQACLYKGGGTTTSPIAKSRVSGKSLV